MGKGKSRKNTSVYLLTLNNGCEPMKIGFKPVILSSFSFSNTWFEISTNNTPVALTNSNNVADIKTSGTNQVTICSVDSYRVCVVFSLCFKVTYWILLGSFLGIQEFKLCIIKSVLFAEIIQYFFFFQAC